MIFWFKHPNQLDPLLQLLADFCFTFTAKRRSSPSPMRSVLLSAYQNVQHTIASYSGIRCTHAWSNHCSFVMKMYGCCSSMPQEHRCLKDSGCENPLTTNLILTLKRNMEQNRQTKPKAEMLSTANA